MLHKKEPTAAPAVLEDTGALKGRGSKAPSSQLRRRSDPEDEGRGCGGSNGRVDTAERKALSGEGEDGSHGRRRGLQGCGRGRCLIAEGAAVFAGCPQLLAGCRRFAALVERLSGGSEASAQAGAYQSGHIQDDGGAANCTSERHEAMIRMTRR